MFRRIFAAGALIVAAAGLAGCGGNSVTRLTAGDCFTADAIGEGGEVSDVSTVSCTAPHEYEVVAVHTHEDEAWPGAAAIEVAAYEACVAEFEEYVDSQYATSSIFMVPMTPTESGWGQGDRDSLCLAESDTRSSSVQGSGE
nr:hypothetical protein [Actinomycetales bacterium]